MKMELIRKYPDLGPTTMKLSCGGVVHRAPLPPELLKLGVIIPNSDSYKEYLDSEEWKDVDIPEGYSIFLFPKDIWDNIDKMAELLLNLGIICSPKYQIRIVPLVTNHEFDTGRRIVYVEVTKDGVNYKRIPHFFNEFLHVVEDPNNLIGKFVEEIENNI
jgi:hypothetical protein